jgi:acyl carrier protein phosphodiesterase
MAKAPAQKDMITRLAEQGEEAFQRIAEAFGGVRFVETMNGMRERVDDMSKKIRSLDPLEKRVAELERRLDALSKPAAKVKPKATRSTAGRKTASTRAKSTARKTSSS